MNAKINTMLASAVCLASLSCTPEAPRAYYPAVFEKVKSSAIVVDPRVDILFVVDDSGSMGVHQENLAKNIEKFTDEFSKKSFIEFNIGTITTDNYYGDCCGKLIGNPKVVTKATPNFNMVLKDTLQPGTSGWGTEQIFDPLVLALSPPLITGANAGFYRDQAKLALIFITDAEDQSEDHTPDTTYDFLLNLKHGDPSKVIGYGVIVPSNDTRNCPRDEGTPPTKIEKFLGMMPNKQDNIMNLCDPDYGARLAALAKNLVNEVTTIRLDRVPYVPSIKVMWGNVELPQDWKLGWAFDSSKNAIVLGDGIDWTAQPSGTPLTVTFDTAKY